MTTIAPPPVYLMVSSSLPTGLRSHLINGVAGGVVIIGQKAGKIGLHRFMDMLMATQRRRYHDTVIMPTEVLPQTTASIRGIFDDVATGSEFRFLPEQDLVAALKAPDADDRAVGASYSPETDLLTFVTGDRQRLVVPVTAIPKHSVMGVPDLKAIVLTDGGHTVGFGKNYEIAFDGLRYAHDPEYRKVVRQRARDQDQSFGACLRRARFHHGRGQGDLGTTDRTIRRIESGVMPESAISANTRKKIEKGLGISFQKIKIF